AHPLWHAAGSGGARGLAERNYQMSSSQANAEKGAVAAGPPQSVVSKSRGHWGAARRIGRTDALAERGAASRGRSAWPRRRSGGVQPRPVPYRGVACPPTSPAAQKRGGRLTRSCLIYASQTIKKYKRMAPSAHAR